MHAAGFFCLSLSVFFSVVVVVVVAAAIPILVPVTFRRFWVLQGLWHQMHQHLQQFQSIQIPEIRLKNMHYDCHFLFGLNTIEVAHWHVMICYSFILLS